LNQSSPATPFTVRVAMARPAAAFVQTGSMTVARAAHTATLLLDGRVLIAGGGSASAELYDATSQTFTATGSMTLAQDARSATLLANSRLPNYGKVLMAGGGDLIAELFDPTAGTFTATGSMGAQHLGQTATLLQNGQVLIAGGETAKAELFNPSTGAFTATGSMTVSRSGHTATLLPDGRVLIAGGVLDFGAGGTVPVPEGPGAASAELYDPVSGTFTSTGSMSVGRSGHTATLLVDGTVLLAGTGNTAELFNPGTGNFSVVGELLTPRCGQATATLRNDSTVLVAGGRSCGRGAASRATAELFAPESGGFVATGSLITARDGHRATRLVDGTVLITGGTTHSYTCSGYMTCSVNTLVLSSAELFK
ncbi:MAG: Kelch repeat-containing protein, partial [Steroidobacteraceae bacterium]